MILAITGQKLSWIKIKYHLKLKFYKTTVTTKSIIMKNNLCISLLLTILLSSFYACDKDNNSIEIKTLEVEQGNDASTLISVLGAAKGGELTNEDIDHYCILSFQRLFSDDNRYYFKTLSARTINTPMIQSLRIDEHTIPPLDGSSILLFRMSEINLLIKITNSLLP